MPDLVEIEHRLAVVEAGLNRVQSKLKMTPPGKNWVDEVSGSLADLPDEDYRRYLEHCRAARDSISAGEDAKS